MDQIRRQLADWIAPHTDGVAAAQIVEWLTKPQAGWGDLALPCYRVKVGGKIKNEAAALLAAKLRETRHPLVAELRADAAYLNLVLNPQALAHEVLKRADEFAAQHFQLPDGKDRVVAIDFSSPNVAKEFSLGHLRSTMLGNSILRLYQAAGWHTEAINHLGDWGHQFGVVILAFQDEGNEQDLERDPIRYLQGLYVKYSMREKAEGKLEEAQKAGKPYDGRVAFRGKPRKGETDADAMARTQELLDADPYLKHPLPPTDPKSVTARAQAIDAALQAGDKNYRALWARFRELSIEALKKTYADLRITFDHYMGESFFEDKMLPVIERIRSLGLLVQSEGAQVVELDASLGRNKDGSLKVCVILKKDGSSNYATRDLAAAVYRRDAFRFDRNLYVVDHRQSEHFAAVFQVLKKIGYDWATDCIHVPFGAVLADGEVMSTRLGNVILFEDYVAKNEAAVLAIMNPTDMPDANEETRKRNAQRREQFEQWRAEAGLAAIQATARSVAKAAIIFAMLKVGRMEDVNYRSSEAVSFEGETGPRVQYIYARICNVVRHYETVFGKPHNLAEFDPTHFTFDQERHLLRLVGEFKGVMRRALAEHEPYHIARYALELADWFNSYYYQVVFVQSEQPAESSSRVGLVRRVGDVVRQCLWLLGIDAPDRM